MHNPRVRRVNISAVTVKVQFSRSQSVFISFLESEIARAILARRSTLYWVIPVLRAVIHRMGVAMDYYLRPFTLQDRQ